MSDEEHGTTVLTGRDEFLEALDACEQTSAALLLTLEVGTGEPVALVARRSEQIERLISLVPKKEACVGDLERLKVVLSAGEKVWRKALADKLSATRSLMSLQRSLQVARQLAAANNPRQSGIDCTG